MNGRLKAASIRLEQIARAKKAVDAGTLEQSDFQILTKELVRRAVAAEKKLPANFWDTPESGMWQATEEYRADRRNRKLARANRKAA